MIVVDALGGEVDVRFFDEAADGVDAGGEGQGRAEALRLDEGVGCGAGSRSPTSESA